MELLDEHFCQFLFCVVYDIVYAAEVVDSLHDIIHVNSVVRHADSVCFEDIACLLVRQTTALNMILVVCQVNLRAMIDAAFQLRRLLFS